MSRSTMESVKKGNLQYFQKVASLHFPFEEVSSKNDEILRNIRERIATISSVVNKIDDAHHYIMFIRF